MSLKFGISSMSIGRAAYHSLPIKINEAVAHHIQGIEVFYEDLETLAHHISPSPSPSASPPSTSSLLEAAKTIRTLCDERDLEIICLQPFMHYEGLKDRKRHAERIEEMKIWFQLAHALRVDIIQIPASFLPVGEITDDLDIVVSDLRALADLGGQQNPPLRFAYENLCWSTYFDRWQQGYEIVEMVDRDNFGLCLDTFHIAGGVYGDPTFPSGRRPNGEDDLRNSLRELVEKIDVKKIFFVQVVDGERLESPLVKGHPFYVEGQPARMSWSRNARVFALEDHGYLPVMDVVRAIVEGLGYQGWLSMELFSRTMGEPGAEIPAEHARRAEGSWNKILKEMEKWKA